MELYERIRQRRNELNMSQEELAKILGYSDRSTIARIELGKNDITQSKIVAIAKALRTTPAYLMGWEIVNNGISIIGNENSHNTINHSLIPLTENLAEIEKELLHICSRLNTKQKNELLSFAYKLESKEEK